MGTCEWCRQERPLQCCHVLPRGAYPSLTYDIENAFAGCWACHLGPKGWHKNPLAAAEWIRGYWGATRLEALRLRGLQKSKKGYADTKQYLTECRDRLVGKRVAVTPDLRTRWGA